MVIGTKTIWNPYAIDYSAGVDLMPDGTVKPRKVGCYVYSIEEAEKVLKEREENGQ